MGLHNWKLKIILKIFNIIKYPAHTYKYRCWSVQLIINAIQIYLGYTVEPLKEFMQENPWAIYVSLALMFVFQYALINFLNPIKI